MKRSKGFVLIFILWVLSFLTVLAVGLAASIRQKIVLVEKLDERSRVSHLLMAAVKHAALYTSNQVNLSGQSYTLNVKMNLHNNPNEFSRFALAEDEADVSYAASNHGISFGVMDEERKINLNITTKFILSRLLERVLAMKPEDAGRFAEDILDWRQFGESQAKGFFSDQYYENLTYPYSKKDSSYETLDELLLVKGMTKDIYKELINYVTIYGYGKININTASAEILYALGLEDPLIEKILEVRQGKDQLEATVDDRVFVKTFDIATEINTMIKLLPEEIRAIDQLNQQGLLTTNSHYFSIDAQARLNHSLFSKTARAVFGVRENRLLYWSERN